jgi:outer membrane protein assembly factor BamE (lipoprotein component of BamABCDE complex)
MIEDLLDNHELDGSRMSQEQVVALLGPPDPDPYFTPSDWVYCLGPQRSGLPIDNDWLTFVFDQDARVERVYIATD